MKRLKWKLGSVCLDIVLILMQDRCTVCMEHTICLEINLDAPGELLDDVCLMESRFGLFRNSVSFSARYGHGLRLMHHSLRNHFGSTCWYFGEEAQVEARFDLFEIELIFMQDRCTVCLECTICLEINLDAPNGTPR